jgi:hypothetical protein
MSMSNISHPPTQQQGRTYLHLNVQNTNPSPLPHILDSLHTRAIQIAAKLRVLNKTIGIHQFPKIFPRDKVVLAPVLFASTRAAGGVRNAETKALGVLGEEALEEGGFAGA